MLKSVDDITILDYDKIERTGSVRHLLSWKWLPMFLFARGVDRLMNQLITMLNVEDLDDAIEDREWQILSLLRINQLRLNYFGIYNIYENQSKCNSLKKFFDSYTKKKFKESTTNRLNTYIQTIHRLSGIQVKSIKDLKLVAKDIEFKMDKYHENFDKAQKGDPIGIVQFSAGIFITLGMSYDQNITLRHLVELKKLAIDKWQKSKK